MKQSIEANGGECFAVAADVRDYEAVEKAIAANRRKIRQN